MHQSTLLNKCRRSISSYLLINFYSPGMNVGREWLTTWQKSVEILYFKTGLQLKKTGLVKNSDTYLEVDCKFNSIDYKNLALSPLRSLVKATQHFIEFFVKTLRCWHFLRKKWFHEKVISRKIDYSKIINAANEWEIYSRFNFSWKQLQYFLEKERQFHEILL